MARNERPPHAATLPHKATIQTKIAEPERPPHPAKLVQRREAVPPHMAKVAQRAALPNNNIGATARCTIKGTQRAVNDKKSIDNNWDALSGQEIRNFCNTATIYPLWHLGLDFDHPCALYGTWAFGNPATTVVFFRYEPTQPDLKVESWAQDNAHTTSRATLLATYAEIDNLGHSPRIWIRTTQNEIALNFCLATVYNGRKTAKKNCFLTTACTRARGLPDDCFELETLRAFRDDYLLRQPGGSAVVEAYYDLAPRILEAIESRTDPDARFEQLYDELVAPCVRLIVSGKERAAVELYTETVRALERAYLGDVRLR
jgi:hypothetical protein